MGSLIEELRRREAAARLRWTVCGAGSRTLRRIWPGRRSRSRTLRAMIANSVLPLVAMQPEHRVRGRAAPGARETGIAGVRLVVDQLLGVMHERQLRAAAGTVAEPVAGAPGHWPPPFREVPAQNFPRDSRSPGCRACLAASTVSTALGASGVTGLVRISHSSQPLPASETPELMPDEN
jgi:hypothetical protein